LSIAKDGNLPIGTTRRPLEFADEMPGLHKQCISVGLIRQKNLIGFQAKFIDAQSSELRIVAVSNNSITKLKLAEKPKA
jgi:hypothetical protein